MESQREAHHNGLRAIATRQFPAIRVRPDLRHRRHLVFVRPNRVNRMQHSLALHSTRAPRLILVVADFFHPVDDVAVELFLNGDMRHARGRRGSMPVLLAG